MNTNRRKERGGRSWEIGDRKKKGAKRDASVAAATWDLTQLYKSPEDPQIEKDLAAFEKDVAGFAKKYDTSKTVSDTAGASFTKNEESLFKALTEFENLSALFGPKFYVYFYLLRDIDSSNTAVSGKMSLIESRLAQASNKLVFLRIAIGKIPAKDQAKFLASKKLSHFYYHLKCAFEEAKHNLSVEAEQIMSLKDLPAQSMWVTGNEKILNSKTVAWKGKKIPVSEFTGKLRQERSQGTRQKMGRALADVLESVADFSEPEINAVYSNKKIDDELRRFARPYDATVLQYKNDPQVVKSLIETVTANFKIAHRFQTIRAKMLKTKKLYYSDRNASIGAIKTKFTFDESAAKLREVLNRLNPRFAKELDLFMSEKRVDAFPRVGKSGGAYQLGVIGLPTFVLLNHVDDLNSFKTLSHEMGHAMHTELSNSQGPLYSTYSFSLAETASTLFQTLALDAVLESLPDTEKIIALHDEINDNISTIFRQVACFNYEIDIHDAVRSKGYISKQELADLHNKHMGAYLGPIFELEQGDGYFFVTWSHIRRFFYVYSYAYGMLVTKALLRRYKKDKSFWTQIEKFLSAGGTDSPENILKSIGIDVSKPDFWMEGLREIEDDIKRLEELTSKK